MKVGADTGGGGVGVERAKPEEDERTQRKRVPRRISSTSFFFFSI